MKDLSQKLNFSMKWNAIESISYKFILALHQVIFYFIANRYIYGLSSTIFAIIYLTVELANLGFDRSLAQLLQTYTKPKNFKQFLLPQIILLILILIALGASLTFGYNILSICFSSGFKCNFLSTNEWLLLVQ